MIDVKVCMFVVEKPEWIYEIGHTNLLLHMAFCVSVNDMVYDSY